MGTYMKVSTQRLEEDKAGIQNELKGIGQSVEELSQEIQLLGQTWEGPAWAAFQNQAASDIENMQAIYEKLSVYISHIENASKEYRTCENQVGNLIDRIRI